MFKERLSENGIRESKYFNDNSLNAFAGTNLQMPNCTAYCVFRISESIDGVVNVRDNIIFARKGAPEANLWYPQTLWKKGSRPKVGAIACWDGASGHVAIVERINSDGSITVSQSNHKKTFWELKTYSPEVDKVTPGVGLPFQGYIYNPYIKDLRTEKSNDILQVEVVADHLNVRTAPNGDVYTGRFCPVGTYNVLSIEHNGDYDWAKIDDSSYIALNEGVWTKLNKSIKPEPSPEPTPSPETTLEVAIATMQADLSLYEIYKAKLKDDYDIIGRLMKETIR